jgi:hypothetical protein
MQQNNVNYFVMRIERIFLRFNRVETNGKGTNGAMDRITQRAE